ncbi:MAG: hypothetical protein M1514_00600 [Patescibacteria group bacterium]|nr:hypothetical protein [Patescibacteria group bacterium]
MTKKTRIAFDLDGVVIDKPPLVPKQLIEFFFRGCHPKKELHYRFPQLKLEQVVRKISHFYLFRPEIKGNIKFIKGLGQNNYELFIVSGRYSFLQKETENWLKKREMRNVFKEIFLNFNNEQPHLYKEKILIKLQPDIFVDDDPEIAGYLADKLSKTKVYCFSKKIRGCCQKAEEITCLSQILK